MEFRQDGDNMGSRSGGSDLNGIMVGSVLSKDDGNKTMMLAAIVIVIVFIIAILAFAILTKDNNRVADRNYNGGTDIAALLATMTAAKSIDNNGGGAIDKFEIMQKIEHSEDRARETQTQQEIAAQGKSFMEIGFGLSSKIDAVEKEQLKTYAVIQNQLGMQSEALKQLLTGQNNDAIINGVIQRLRAC